MNFVYMRKRTDKKKIGSTLEYGKIWNKEDLLKWKKEREAIIIERKSYFYHMTHFFDGLDLALDRYKLPASGMISKNGKAVQVIGSRGDMCFWFASPTDQYQLGNKIYKRWTKDPNSFTDFKADQLSLETKVDRFVLNYLKNDKIELLNIGETLELLKKSNKLMSEALALAVCCMAIDSYLLIILNQKIKNSNERAVISAGTVKSFASIEENEMLLIAELSRDKRSQVIKNHAKKYYYIKNNYSGAEKASCDYFERRIKNITDVFKNKKSIRMELDKRRKEDIINIENYNKIRNKYRDKKLSAIILLTDGTIQIRDFSKQYQMKLFSVITPLMKKINKELGFENDLIFFAQPNEIELIVKDRVRWEQKLVNRKEGILIFWKEGQKKRNLLSGDKAGREMEEINREIDIDKLDGQVAMRGNKIRGVVRIIFDPNNDSWRDGDILVTDMTTPDFVPLMKSASAIITNVGGITCHAAIISRELKKPCIIGTKIATKVLHDGDLVEVDADNGVVKIIKRVSDK